MKLLLSLFLAASCSAQVFSPELIASVFTPTTAAAGIDTTNLTLYLDADTVTASNILNGARVHSWFSRVNGQWAEINNLLFTNSVANQQPTNIFNVVNGKNAVHFNSGQGLSSDLSQSQTNYFTDKYTIVMSIYIDNANGFCVTPRFPTGPLFLPGSSAGSTIQADIPAAARIAIVGPAGTTNAWHVLEIHRNVTTGSIWLDGNQLMFTSALATTAASGTDTVRLGDVGGSPFKGFLRKVLVWNSDKGTNAFFGITRTNIMTDIGK